MDHFERRAKRKRSSSEKPLPLATLSDSEPQAAIISTGQDTPVSPVQLYTISVTTAGPGEAMLLDPNIRGALGSLQSPGHLPVLEAGPALSRDFPVALKSMVRGSDIATTGEPSEVVVVVETPQAPVEDAKANGIVEDMLAAGQRTVVLPAADSISSQASLEPSTLAIDNVSTVEVEELAQVIQEEQGEEEEGEEVPSVQLIAYFETIPNVLPSGPTLVNISPDTVLSSSLGSRPIVSTVPIISKHMPPSPDSLVLTLERLEDNKEEVDRLSEDRMELHGKRLEEHR